MTLIVIHGKDAIELSIVAIAEEIVGRIGSKGLDALRSQFLDGRTDNLLFLIAEDTVLTATWIEGKHGYARIGNAHVATQRLVENFSLVNNLLLRDGIGHILQRHVVGDEGDAQVVAHQDGESVLVLFLGVRQVQMPSYIRCVTIEAMNAVLSHGCSDEHIEKPCSVVGQCTVDGTLCSIAGFGRWHSKVNLHLFVEDGKQVDMSVLGFTSIADDVELRLIA